MKKSHEEVTTFMRDMVKGESPSSWQWIMSRLNTWLQWRTDRFAEVKLDVDSYNTGFCDGVTQAAREPDEAKAYLDAIMYAQEYIHDDP
jgi:hypothetical protein